MSVKSPISMLKLGWLAGILEGEGCFTSTGRSRSSPQIQIWMTDKDTVNKVARLFNRPCIESKKNTKYGWKMLYYTSVAGDDAIGWMFTLYSLMSYRRRFKMIEVINKWKAWKGVELKNAS